MASNNFLRRLYEYRMEVERGDGWYDTPWYDEVWYARYDEDEGDAEDEGDREEPRWEWTFERDLRL